MFQPPHFSPSSGQHGSIFHFLDKSAASNDGTLDFDKPATADLWCSGQKTVEKGFFKSRMGAPRTTEVHFGATEGG